MNESEEMAALRKELDDMSRRDDTTEHEGLLEAIGRRHRHGIRLVERADPLRPFNCVRYALNLCELPAPVVAISEWGLGRVHLSPDFLTYAITEGVLEEIHAAAPATGDLVVYASSRIEHVGVVDAEAVRSKWGKGHLWRHPVLAVPARYGSSVRYFRPPTPRAALSAFYEYARREYGRSLVDRLLKCPRPKAPADRRLKRPE